jgi:hypothetical protein
MLELLTIVNNRFLFSEIGECRKVLDSIMLSQSFVIDFNKVHSKNISIIIDLFQFSKYFITGKTASGI